MTARFTISGIPTPTRVDDPVEWVPHRPRWRRVLALASTVVVAAGLMLTVAAPAQAAECTGGPYTSDQHDVHALPSTCSSVSVHVTVKWVNKVKGDVVNLTRFGPATGYPDYGVSYWARYVMTTSQPDSPDPLSSSDWFYYRGNDTVAVGEAVADDTSQQWAVLGDYDVHITCTFTAAGSAKATPVKLGKVTAKIPATLSTAPLQQFSVGAKHDGGHFDCTITNTHKAGKKLTTAKPVITGKAKVGKKLKVNAKKSKWTAKTTFHYQWLAAGTPIPKATKATLKLTQALKGKAISVQVTGAKKGFTTTVVTSKATKKVKK